MNIKIILLIRQSFFLIINLIKNSRNNAVGIEWFINQYFCFISFLQTIYLPSESNIDINEMLIDIKDFDKFIDKNEMHDIYIKNMDFIKKNKKFYSS